VRLESSRVRNARADERRVQRRTARLRSTARKANAFLYPSTTGETPEALTDLSIEGEKGVEHGTGI